MTLCYLAEVPREQDLEGRRAPESRERVSLLSAVAEYIETWERVTRAELRPSAERVHELDKQATELQQRSVGAGFGGLAHHIAEYTRLLATGAELPRVRGQLSIVSELASQARQALTPEEKAHLALAVPPAARAGGGAAPAPPPLITVARHLDTNVAAALRSAQPEGRSPKRSDALAAVPSPPAAWAAAPSAPPQHPAAPSATPQFSVKSMLGLRAFDGRRTPKGAAAGPANAAPLLSLPRLGAPAGGPSRSSSPPPLLGSEASGLPPLAPDASARYAASARKSAPIEQRRSPIPSSSRPAERSPALRAATPRRSAAFGQRSARPETARLARWVGVAGALVFVGIGLAAFLVLGRGPKRLGPETSPTGPGAASDLGSAQAPKPDVAAPRERLLADDERFMSLLAQVHGHGGTESPELRSLLNEQAALASKALSGPCNDGSPNCKAWAEVRELIVGDRKPAIVKRRRGSDTETTRSRWMAGLKMPGIPVEDDPRVLRVFEFYTENPVGRETFQSMLFRCGAYRDLIQSTLIRYDLPPELLALVFAESGCEASAKSPVGAAGLWQFMPETGRAYHLNIVEGTIDERYSPFKSTEAGIRMLADLRLKLGSWDLVFASYDLGVFGVLARLERVGADATFWDLVDADLLPDETANYAPTVDAIALILANLERLKFAGIQIRAPQFTADLEVPGGTRLSLVARAAATSVTQLRALNLDFSGDVVPLIPGGAIAVQVPKDVVWQARDTIKELLSSKDGADQCVPPTFDWGKQRFTPEMDRACQKRLSAAGRESP